MMTVKTRAEVIINGRDKSKAAFKSFDKSVRLSTKQLATFAGAFTGIAVGRAIINTIVEFEKLEASLVTVTGSSEKATKAFDQIKTFAKTTPFQVQEITNAFIKMKALGLDPSEAALRSYGNTASAMGKSLNDFVEAVADAATGEFERLKEFGIKARSQGDKVSFIFKGVTTTIKKNSIEIEEYLQNIGNTDFAGATTRQMDTLGGAFSNLEDAYAQLADELGKAGLSGIIKNLTEGLIELTPVLSAVITELKGLQDDARAAGIQLFGLFNPKIKTEIDLVNDRLAKTRAQIQKQKTILTRNDLSVYNVDMINAAGIELAKLNTQLEKQTTLLNHIRGIEPATTILGGQGKTKKTAQQVAQEESEKNKKIRAIEQARLDQVLKLEFDTGVKQLEIIDQFARDKAQREQFAFDNRIFMVENAFQSELISYERRNELLQNLNEQHQRSMLAIAERAKTAEHRLWESGLKGKLAVASQVLGSLSSLMNSTNRSQFEIGKKAAVAQAIIDTIGAAQSAYKALAGIPVVGPALGAAAAIAATLAGNQRVNAIKSTTFNRGSANVSVGGGGGVSTGTGFGGGSPIGSPSPSLPENNEPKSITQIYFTQPVYGFDNFSDVIVDIIKDASNNRDVMLIDPNSRQAQEIREAS